ncbi:hypothetical protein [Pararhodospirillum oryzae]|uniref:Uncharacterized protein n=1 Tax=Pararhodospirillum oryzae TaxID=478448 RepID=A0A512H707_9PROT|nr:hypothetical protein [Pararhodospirillum oryzae]GEO81211.1 hypothetical protein ROR02_13420 [Pararhodospirillum oryzae]
MRRHARHLTLGIAGLLALGLLAGALALARFADDPVALLLGSRARVTIPLPESTMRLVLSQTGSGPDRGRLLTVERAGQVVLGTPLYPAASDTGGWDVFWIPETDATGGPFARLIEPGGEILIDLGGLAAVRVVRTAVGPLLTSPKGDARAGAVIGPDGAITVTDGLRVPDLPPGPGLRLGRVLGEARGPWTFQPTPTDVPRPLP